METKHRKRYLKASAIIDSDHPEVAGKARELASGCATDREIAERWHLSDIDVVSSARVPAMNLR